MKNSKRFWTFFTQLKRNGQKSDTQQMNSLSGVANNVKRMTFLPSTLCCFRTSRALITDLPVPEIITMLLLSVPGMYSRISWSAYKSTPLSRCQKTSKIWHPHISQHHFKRCIVRRMLSLIRHFSKTITKKRCQHVSATECTVNDPESSNHWIS